MSLSDYVRLRILKEEEKVVTVSGTLINPTSDTNRRVQAIRVINNDAGKIAVVGRDSAFVDGAVTPLKGIPLGQYEYETLYISEGEDPANEVQIDADTGSSRGAASFTGSGLDDLSSGGVFTDREDAVFEVEIDATGTPDTFKWRKQDADGTWGAYTTGVAITGAAQILSDAVTVTFAATTGHTLADKWTIVCTAGTVVCILHLGR